MKSLNVFNKFGLFIDIDGVIIRGRETIPSAKVAFEKYLNPFHINHIFLTNSGTSSLNHKAEYLSQCLRQKINSSHIVMSYSPLLLFRNFVQRHALISGQGSLTQIARDLGFKNVVTVDQICEKYPLLDMIANKNRDAHSIIPKIETIILFGEPTNWETSFQIMLDVLLTDGYIDKKFDLFPYPHIPIISCNADFLWMAQWKNPRVGQGAFIHCLEALYKKLTGQDLVYATLLGKPNELNYLVAEKLLLNNANYVDALHDIQTIYAIGDNIESDIMGGNVYNDLLSKKAQTIRELKQSNNNAENAYSYQHVLNKKSYAPYVDWDTLQEVNKSSVVKCETILVQTGVYHSELDEEREKADRVSYTHKDFSHLPKTFKKPKHIVKDFKEAVELILELEKNA